MDRRWFLIKVLLPFTEFLGSFLSDARRQKIEARLIHYNNLMLPAIFRNPKPRVLLLLPHCLQFDGCQKEITGPSVNCAKCGKCDIFALLTLSKKYNIIIKVTTGGRLAKRLVGEISPDVVIAVACERELCEGIFGVYPVPVYGIPNKRPNGPCINTNVEIQTVEDAIKTALCFKGTLT